MLHRPAQFQPAVVGYGTGAVAVCNGEDVSLSVRHRPAVEASVRLRGVVVVPAYALSQQFVAQGVEGDAVSLGSAIAGVDPYSAGEEADFRQLFRKLPAVPSAVYFPVDVADKGYTEGRDMRRVGAVAEEGYRRFDRGGIAGIPDRDQSGRTAAPAARRGHLADINDVQMAVAVDVGHARKAVAQVIGDGIAAGGRQSDVPRAFVGRVGIVAVIAALAVFAEIFKIEVIDAMAGNHLQFAVAVDVFNGEDGEVIVFPFRLGRARTPSHEGAFVDLFGFGVAREDAGMFVGEKAGSRRNAASRGRRRECGAVPGHEQPTGLGIIDLVVDDHFGYAVAVEVGYIRRRHVVY